MSYYIFTSFTQATSVCAFLSSSTHITANFDRLLIAAYYI